MSVIVTDISAPVMRARLYEGLHVYACAMGYPAEIVQRRAPQWAEHALRTGWRAVAAFDLPECASAVPSTTDNIDPALTAGTTVVTPPGHSPPIAVPDTAPLIGIAYGYHGAPAYWWDRQVRAALHERRTDTGILSDYFELTEIHVLPSAQGRGVGGELLARLLSGTLESNVLLSTPEVPDEGNRAWRLYRRTRFTDIARDVRFIGDHRPFAVLGRPLPFI